MTSTAEPDSVNLLPEELNQVAQTRGATTENGMRSEP